MRKQQEQRNMPPKMSVRVDDEVVITAGKDRGRRGRITRVIPRENRVVVEGVNMVKRHLGRQPNSLQAGIVDMPAPINRSNVMLICPNCNEPSRVGHAVLPDGEHVRICRNCGESIVRNR